LISQELSLDPVADGLYVGEHPARAGELAAALAHLRARGIGAVVTVCEKPLDPRALDSAGLRGLHLCVADFDAPDPAQLQEAIDFIRAAHQSGLEVLVHCFAGIGRSATVACCHLIAQGMDAQQAIAQVRRARSPYCVESAAQREAVADFARRCGR
jgi:hypothetical protein